MNYPRQCQGLVCVALLTTHTARPHADGLIYAYLAAQFHARRKLVQPCPVRKHQPTIQYCCARCLFNSCCLPGPLFLRLAGGLAELRPRLVAPYKLDPTDNYGVVFFNALLPQLLRDLDPVQARFAGVPRRTGCCSRSWRPCARCARQLRGTCALLPWSL